MGSSKIRRLLSLAAVLLLGACSAFPSHLQSSASKPVPPAPGTKTSNCSPASSQAGDSYIVFGRRYHVLVNPDGYNDRGIASWYGPHFHGKLTSSGVSYNMYGMTAADKVLPLCTWVKVTDLTNGRSAIVQINDRGPFVNNRIIDLSYAAARSIGMIQKGTALVDVRAIAPPSRQPPPNLEEMSRKYPVHKLPHQPQMYLQVGAFTERDHAERLRAHLLLAQVGTVRISKTTVRGHLFYRVLIGPLGDVNTVDSLTDRLDRLGYKQTSVVIQ